MGLFAGDGAFLFHEAAGGFGAVALALGDAASTAGFGGLVRGGGQTEGQRGDDGGWRMARLGRIRVRFGCLWMGWWLRRVRRFVRL